jgi:hypothetical protein
MDYILSWEKFDEVKGFLVQELTKRGAKFDEWDKPNAPWETTEFMHDNRKYNMSLSRRKEDMFGLSIVRIPDMYYIATSESIPYHMNYKDALQVYLKEFE